ncbi:MAG: hypothetical protein WCN95_07375 [bacterium]
MRRALLVVWVVVALTGCDSSDRGKSAEKKIPTSPSQSELPEECTRVVDRYVTFYQSDEFEKMVALYDIDGLREFKTAIAEIAVDAQQDGKLGAFCNGMWGRTYQLSEIHNMTPEAMLVGLLKHKNSARPAGFTASLGTVKYTTEDVVTLNEATKQATLRFAGEDVHGKAFEFKENVVIILRNGQWRLSVDNMVAAMRQHRAAIHMKKATLQRQQGR